MKLTKEIVGGALFMVLSVAVWFLIPSQIEVITDSRINARFVPKIITLTLMAFSAINLVRAILSQRTAPDSPGSTKKMDSMRVLILFVTFVVYSLLLEFIGFEIATILAGCGMLAIIRIKKWHYYVISTVFVVLVGFLFRTFFYVQLP
ncbi:MAG: tripartite tricarboxylate transporter TctB family protein [Sphaerochaeta sp.]|jgi:putative tricarboxylic transport membrane protein|uniref:tripartite tricarboxylate transporter TctB family protein n=1 Tax=unclassified Sphaerochaeta TaxID=2637943 RepID=UPI000A722BCB|nr:MULTISPECIES: tripartite tricarboxylate transporter TctB family protein [unclassified Sphaerochaeta]MCK9602645.1 tripartite tricarboxylate transporter TctB family protein [Sphaerochaeta sp.]MDX9825138.1 tripartite tricarboxylate transporter TctB family protein [Sphaerochaeta sp.]